MATVHQMPPRGFYLAYEVGRLAGVSGARIGQWARHGYIRSSHSEGAPRVYSFQDVAEAMAVHELLEREVPYGRIREEIGALRDRFGVNWPLTQSPVLIGTAGAEIVTAEGDHLYGRGGNLTLDIGDLHELLGQLDRGGWIVRTIPDLRHIEVNPDRLSGRPAIRGKRVPAQNVAEIAETPRGRLTLVEGYDLTEPEINDAKRWWHATREFERAVA
jgi:uncharacterized protein (DUF433 family)